jgi:hypothetical protein
MKVTQAQIDEHIASGSWRQLEITALAVISAAERASGQRMQPVMGGGTRLMLALRHRISDDIDLFIRDPQWIGYLTPRLNDDVGQGTVAYDESSDFLKLRYPSGEVDFIVRMSLLGGEPQPSDMSVFPLEPVSEVLAKKLFYRGWALTARDLFDWWAIRELMPTEIDAAEFGSLLRGRVAAIDMALQALPRAGGARQRWDAIRAERKPTIEEAAAEMRRELGRYVQAVRRDDHRRVDRPAS